MAKTTKSASDYTEELAGLAHELGEKIAKAAAREISHYKAQALIDEYIQPSNRKTYSDRTPDECVLNVVTTYPPLAKVARLQAAAQRFADNGGEVSEDFKAGLLMAVKLMQDEDYDY